MQYFCAEPNESGRGTRGELSIRVARASYSQSGGVKGSCPDQSAEIGAGRQRVQRVSAVRWRVYTFKTSIFLYLWNPVCLHSCNVGNIFCICQSAIKCVCVSVCVCVCVGGWLCMLSRMCVYICVCMCNHVCVHVHVYAMFYNPFASIYMHVLCM